MAWAPYKVHLHQFADVLAQPWLQGYRGRCSGTTGGSGWTCCPATPERPTDAPARTAITGYQRFLKQDLGLAFADYEALWRWSVTDLRGFWGSIWAYFDIESPTPYRTELVAPVMPGAQLVPGRAGQLRAPGAAPRRRRARRRPPGHRVPERAHGRAGRHPLARAAAPGGGVRHAAARLGVQRGDRVCAYLPNTPHAIVAFLAWRRWARCGRCARPTWGRWRCSTASARSRPGADRGRRPVLRRPSLHDRRAGAARAAGRAAQRAAPGAAGRRWTRRWPTPPSPTPDARRTASSAGPPATPPPAWQPDWLPFDHPLWVVYSSGTTGLPKPIVHGHGGVMLEMLKMAQLHNDVGPSVATGDRYHWYSSTGWIMWNAQVGALLGGTTICVYDGNPGVNPATGAPDLGRAVALCRAAGATFFGAGAAFYANCLKAGVRADAARPTCRACAPSATGSPLSDECYDWIWQQLPHVDGQPVWIAPISGGTDFAGAFVGGLRTLPVVRGEMQVRCLGAKVEAYSDPDAHGVGRPLIDEVGELVCTVPMPSMPLFLWGDDERPAAARQLLRHVPRRAGPGIWRHGDWIRIVPRGDDGHGRPTHHGAIIYGRSDATINRHGIRMGTAELYRAVEVQPEVLDSLVVDLEYLGRAQLDAAVRGAARRPAAGRRAAGAAARRHQGRAVGAPRARRHLPGAAMPRTLSGKKMELPVKKLLLGADPAKVLNRDAMANAECIDWFLDLARQRQRSG
jgi:acetoacetyl-CoA synthetase